MRQHLQRLALPAAASAALVIGIIWGAALDDDRDLNVGKYAGAPPTINYDDDASEPIRARQACDSWDEFQSMVANVQTEQHAQMANSMLLFTTAQAWATRLWDNVITYMDVYINGLNLDVTQHKTNIAAMCGDLRPNET